MAKLVNSEGQLVPNMSLVVSVKVELERGRTLRPYGLVEVPMDHTVMHLFEDLCNGVLNTGDNWVLLDQAEQIEPRAFVGDNMTGIKQAVPLTMKVETATAFGKFVTFQVRTSYQDNNPAGPRKNAFQLLMGARQGSQTVWPKLKDLSRPNQKFKLHNDIVGWLQSKGLGWAEKCKSLGDNFVTTLADIMWLISPHQQKLAARACHLPSVFENFYGYNTPRDHKHCCKGPKL